MLTKILRTFRMRTRYAMCLLRIAGFGAFFDELFHQFYCKYVLVCFDTPMKCSNPVPAKVKYNLSLATAADINEIFKLAKHESHASRVKLAYNKWLYDTGFRTCYVARVAENNEIGCFYFPISSEDLRKVDKSVITRFPPLKDDEIFIDGAYTFEKYRGNRLHSAILNETMKIYADRGYTRHLGHIRADNSASLVSVSNIGSVPYEEIRMLKLLFFTKRTIKKLEKKAEPTPVSERTSSLSGVL